MWEILWEKWKTVTEKEISSTIIVKNPLLKSLFILFFPPFSTLKTLLCRHVSAFSMQVYFVTENNKKYGFWKIKPCSLILLTAKCSNASMKEDWYASRKVTFHPEFTFFHLLNLDTRDKNREGLPSPSGAVSLLNSTSLSTLNQINSHTRV